MPFFIRQPKPDLDRPGMDTERDLSLDQTDTDTREGTTSDQN